MTPLANRDVFYFETSASLGDGIQNAGQNQAVDNVPANLNFIAESV